MLSTGAPVIAAKEAPPTNRSLVGVCTTRTLWPAFVASRIVLERLVGRDAAADTQQDPRHVGFPPYRGLAVAVLDLAVGDFLERDRAGSSWTPCRPSGRELLERALPEVVVVRVDLARALGGDDHARVVGVDVLEQAIDAGEIKTWPFERSVDLQW